MYGQKGTVSHEKVYKYKITILPIQYAFKDGGPSGQHGEGHEPAHQQGNTDFILLFCNGKIILKKKIKKIAFIKRFLSLCP